MTKQTSNEDQNTNSRIKPGFQIVMVAVSVGILAALLFACVVLLPRLLYPPLTDKDLDEQKVPAGKDRIMLRDARLKLQNDARTTLLQGLGALLVLTGAGIGASVGFRQVRVSREQLQAMRTQISQAEVASLRQFQLAEEGNLTERFTRAVDQLGHKEPDVRIGGIFGLQRLAMNSELDRASVAEILAAFVRSHSPWPPSFEHQLKEDAVIGPGRSVLRFYAPDVQAAMTVLGTLGRPSMLSLFDLAHVDLRGANLWRAKLEWAMLLNSNLENAILSDANLTRADLTSVNLKNSFLYRTNFTEAILKDANLTGATADSKTVWPDGFDPEAAGVVFADPA
jgi:hypothetical protein